MSGSKGEWKTGASLLLVIFAYLVVFSYAAAPVAAGVYSLVDPELSFMDGFMFSLIDPLSGSVWHVIIWVVCAVAISTLVYMMVRDFTGSGNSTSRSKPKSRKAKGAKRTKRGGK